MGKVPLNLPFSRLNNPRSLKPSHMTHAPFLNHLYGTLLDLLQYVHVSPVTRSPSLGTGPRHRWSPLPQGQLMAYGHLGVHLDPKGLSGVMPVAVHGATPAQRQHLSYPLVGHHEDPVTFLQPVQVPLDGSTTLVHQPLLPVSYHLQMC